MKRTRGEGKKTTAGVTKTSGRLHLLERFVHTERLPMSNEWVVKLGNKDGAQIDIRQCVTKQEAVNFSHFVGQIVCEMLEAVDPSGMNNLLAPTVTLPLGDKIRSVEWHQP